MSIGHIVGTFSEPFIKAPCSYLQGNSSSGSDVTCSVFAVGAHELVIEPIVDAIVYSGIGAIVSGNYNFLQHFEPYSFIAKLTGSYMASKVAENVLWESVIISAISGMAGSLAAENIPSKLLCAVFNVAVYDFLVKPMTKEKNEHEDDNNNSSVTNINPLLSLLKFAASYGSSAAAEQYYGESILVSSITGVAGSYLADLAYQNFASSNHTHSEI